MIYGLAESTLNQIIDAFNKNSKIKEVILFGSRAKGNYRVGSDIDLALKGEELTSDDVMKLSLALDDLYLPYKFDILLYHTISEPALVDHIDRVGKKIFPL